MTLDVRTQGGWFLTERMCRVPTLRLVMAAILFLVLLFLALVFTIHPFLAQTDPVNGSVLVVEGWLPDYALEEALAVFRKGEYSLIVTTGEPLQRGYYLADYGTYAELARAIMIERGAGQDSIVAVPSPMVRMDRTYAAAVSVREWFGQNHIVPAAIDLFSQGPHARRSRILFQLACGDSVHVGVFAGGDTSYDADRWWDSSRGFQTVVNEAIGLLYVWVCPPG